MSKPKPVSTEFMPKELITQELMPKDKELISQEPIPKELIAKELTSKELIPKELMPREKLLSHGVEALSDIELLAIVLRTGVAGMNVFMLAQLLLTSFGSLRQLFQAPANEVCAHKGIGEASYAILQAVAELNRRALAESLKRGDALTSPQMTKDYLRSQLREQEREVFRVLFLDAQHRVIADEVLFSGTIDSASVYPREVVKTAMRHNAAALILAHNHPSGVAEPSEADKQITRKLMKALELIDVRVLDHFVVGDSAVVSFAERGLI
ncbi:MAG: RadC family protein [Vibrio sp.]